MSKKQAVLLIHGIGEQVPMDTLHSFVDAVWITDATIRRPNVPGTAWSKPDDLSGNFELRRLTTAENRNGQRTDFFEFYWAHLMDGTQLGHVRAWLKVLLLRHPSRVPPQLRGIWWTIALLGVLAAAVGGWHFLISPLPAQLLKIGSTVWFIIGSTLIWFLIRYAGDAARYLHVAPPNIQSRRQIREAGIDLVEKLHREGKYDRIILVGHSLGAVIGYDILTHLWPRYHLRHRPTPAAPGHPALETLEAQAKPSSTSTLDVNKYQAGQAAYLQEIQDQGSPWLISDFITLGSPLAHATMLLSRNEAEFRKKREEREFPTCPPTLETVQGTPRFSFEVDRGHWVPHHAAVFAVTRWTNLFFPCRRTLWGDVIGGPAAPVFGPGVRDVPVHTSLNGGIFTHTKYWTMPESAEAPAHVQALRKALGICK